MQSSPRRRMAPGFTLVEILVVVVIITILASLLTAAVFTAIGRAETTRIIAETAALANAMEQFKNTYDYPPDFSDLNVVKRFVAAQFRNRDATLDKLDRNGNGVDDLTEPGRITPDEALVLWLQGMSPDRTRPFTGGGTRTSLFDFDKTRLTDRDNDKYLEYVPQSGENCPYIYFDSRTYATTVTGLNWKFASFTNTHSPLSTRGAPAPYISGPNNTDFVEPTRFQIISAGPDGDYGGLDPGFLLNTPGSERYYPVGTGYKQADLDNITSFYSGVLEDAIP